MALRSVLAYAGLVFPRLALLATWLFTPRVTIAFEHGLLVPAAGVLFLPCTLLFYVLAYAPTIGVTGFGWLFVGIGVVVDSISHAYPSRSR